MKSAWLIAAAVLIPLLLFMIFQSGFAAREERRGLESTALSEARSLTTAADAILQHSMGAVDALGTVRTLRTGDVADFDRRAGEIAKLNPDWATVQLTSARSGKILVDLRRPLGTQLGNVAPRALPKTTHVGGVVREGENCPCVAIERGAIGPDGGFIVTALLSVRPFFKLLPPANGRYAVSAIVTDEGVFVARSLDQANRVGTLGSKYLRSAVAGTGPGGLYRGFTLEGVQNYTAFARSSLTGWSGHLALGSSAIDSPTWRFLGSLGAAAILSLLLALALVGFALRQLAASRRAAERGQQAQKLEALGQLTGGIAHDFNNLLTPIVGALDFLLMRSTLDERARRIANGALASAQRAGKLTAQLLAFSRRQKLEIEAVDIAALLSEMRPLLDQAAGKDHAVEIRIAPHRLWARSDLNQLELAVLNLVINARDATPDGGTITIEAAGGHEGGKDGVIIRVIDAGQGMTAEVRRRALEPFYTTKPGGRGTGLGLAQVFGVMQQSGGDLKISSRPGEGTTITLLLPASAEEPSSLQRPQKEVSNAAEAPARRFQILIVDDDPAVRSTVARLFEDDGHVVDSVGDARIALRAIEVCHYDLAIVDFAMPVMDGAELIRAARAVRPTQKFLMVTGYSDSDAVTAACPDTPVVRKPFDGEALRRTVLELVD